MHFQKPPLIELIAELRWGSPPFVIPLSAGGAQLGAVPQPSSVGSKQEELFMRFGAKVAADGYSSFERIAPPGFPVMPFQAVYRYRTNAPIGIGSLFQLGPGLFTANITPPYETWGSFRPIVERGVQLLLESRDEAEKALPFGTAMLRYIDAFRPNLTEGRSALQFITDVLGFSVSLPPVVRDQADSDQGTHPSLHLQFRVPLKTGLVMNLTVAEGVADNEQAVIMDTSVVNTSPVPADIASIMNAFEAAHEVIHTSFMGMTEKISALMQPSQGV